MVDPSTWTRRARTGATSIDDLLDPARALDLFAGGATIVLQSLHRWWPAVRALCRDLEVELGHAVQANAYLTPGGATGLAPHHDTHDVFVLQVHGTKDWTVRRPVTRAPLARQRSDHAEAAAQPVLFEASLAPGDVLYLPRGFVHSASAQRGVSLHLTVGVLATTAADVLRRLVDRATDDARFRRTLTPGWPGDAALAAAEVAGVVADLRRWLDDVDPTAVADELGQRFWAARNPLLGGHLAELAGLAALDDTTEVRLRPSSPILRDADDGRLVVTLGERRIDLPPALAPALDRLLDGSTRPVGDLADLLDAGSRLVLVRRLVREGVLVTVPGG
ncbi:MAG TPA: cupin domain-containing protein [Acidimicrobiales bacterium]|nr:cupin domain-containing protein [Acidimicrobiales bacterium]